MKYMPPKYIETLDIENFLSIKEFHWDIKQFNIITGDMGSGKSLCIKLLCFFEGIFRSSILLAPGISKQIFENGNFFERFGLPPER
jgi:AAA15 family ATPase/GTPase